MKTTFILLYCQLAARRGYDSIQFTKHCDMSCRPELCLTEVVLIGTDGSSSCPPARSTSFCERQTTTMLARVRHDF